MINHNDPLPPENAAPSPTCMADAVTRSSLLHGPDAAACGSYYQEPVRDYLLHLQCPPAKVEALTSELLERLQTNILLSYDRAAPFRPHLKLAIRNWYLGHLRRNHQDDLARTIEARVDVADLESDALEDGLVDYARQGYHVFSLEADASLKVGIAMLEAWIIDGVDQADLAQHWKLTDRQVRNWLARTADQLAAWLHGHLHAQDTRALVRRALKQHGPVDLEPAGLRRLFSHLSRKKRRDALLILSLIMQHDRTAGKKPCRVRSCRSTPS